MKLFLRVTQTGPEAYKCDACGESFSVTLRRYERSASCHALGCTACRRAEKKLYALGRQDAQD